MKAKFAAVWLEPHLCAPRLPRAGSSGGGGGTETEGEGRAVGGSGWTAAPPAPRGFGGEGRRPRREDEAAGVLRLKTEQQQRRNGAVCSENGRGRRRISKWQTHLGNKTASYYWFN